MNRLTELPEDFARLNLPEPLERAILDLGFQNTTPVQAEVLPHSLDGADIIAQAQTGTGKTAAFLLSIITYDLENPTLDSSATGNPVFADHCADPRTGDANCERCRIVD